MEIRHLVSFLQLAIQGSFTKAGEALGYSQANISLQIRQLENELGVQLFDRIGKTAHLTQYGQMLVPYAQEIVSTATTIENMFLEPENLRGTLRVGFTESLFQCLFQETLLCFHKTFPLVTVDVNVDSTTALLKSLRSGQLDIICLVGDYSEDPDLNCWADNDCNMLVVSNNDHPLTSRLKLDPGDLDGQEFILMEDSAPYVIDFNQWLRQEELTIIPCVKVQIPYGAIQLLQKGSYLSILPDFTVMDYIHDKSVTHLNIEGFSLKQSVQFLTHKSKVLTPQIEGFLKKAAAVFQDLKKSQ